MYLLSLMLGMGDPIRCTLVNNTKEPLSATTWVYKKAFSVSNLQPGASYTFEFSAEGEGAYLVFVEFESGRSFTEAAGYFDSGGWEHVLHVVPTGVELDVETAYAPIPMPPN